MTFTSLPYTHWHPVCVVIQRVKDQTHQMGQKMKMAPACGHYLQNIRQRRETGQSSTNVISAFMQLHLVFAPKKIAIDIPKWPFITGGASLKLVLHLDCCLFYNLPMHISVLPRPNHGVSGMKYKPNLLPDENCFVCNHTY